MEQFNRNDPRFAAYASAFQQLNDDEFSLVMKKLMADAAAQEDEPSKETNG